MEGILHSTPDGPSLCLQGGKQNGGGPRHQREACEEVSWEETLKDLPGEAKRSYGEALALGHQHSQGPDALKAFIGKETLASNILTAQGSWDLLCQVQERRGCHTGP